MKRPAHAQARQPERGVREVRSRLRCYLALAATVAVVGASGGPQRDVPSQGKGPWRVVSDRKFSTVVAYDTSRVTRLPLGRVDVWERYTLHPPRHDPDGPVGSIVMRVVADCAAQQTAVESIAKYSPGGKLMSQHGPFPAREDDFTSEIAGSVDASALQGLCSALHAGH
jgi:hypothetical protein